MIGIDTNILVRAFLEDDINQAHLAQVFMEMASQDGGLFISSYALLEFAWVLKVKKFSRKEIYQALITLTDSPGITIGQRDVILAAAEKFYKGKADFGDYMILAEGEKYGGQLLKSFDQTFAEESPHISAPD
ncbi:PIN domain-containing protein [Candidatus Paracaedibacter symbiosus]|uniref:PIN domain-containing protein n=1 Tax=Candidatus Paracaedibacter symbiosus TaxID=244582 RepID=UPI00094E8016|nr:type II toxin-antitoxin system VapC family toxin [Candidatus Paracaedibacter symbiosus]